MPQNLKEKEDGYMNLTKPIRATLSAQIAQQIEECIKEGVWPVGSKIPSELELMKEFDVSRNTIREAIFSLVHVGILQPQQGDGTYVKRDDRLDATLQDWLKSAEVSDILETRLILESAIIRSVCGRATPEDLEKISQVYQKRKLASTEAIEIFTEADQLFHLQIAASCHNSVLYGLYESFFSFLKEVFTMYQSYSSDAWQNNEHEALYQAIMARDAEGACAVIQEIIRSEEKLFADEV